MLDYHCFEYETLPAVRTNSKRGSADLYFINRLLFLGDFKLVGHLAVVALVGIEVRYSLQRGRNFLYVYIQFHRDAQQIYILIFGN